MENRKVYLDKHTNLLQLEEHMRSEERRVGKECAA